MCFVSAAAIIQLCFTPFPCCPHMHTGPLTSGVIKIVTSVPVHVDLIALAIVLSAQTTKARSPSSQPRLQSLTIADRLDRPPIMSGLGTVVMCSASSEVSILTTGSRFTNTASTLTGSVLCSVENGSKGVDSLHPNLAVCFRGQLTLVVAWSRHVLRPELISRRKRPCQCPCYSLLASRRHMDPST